MFPNCCVPGCNAAESQIKYCFPYRDRTMTKVWMKALSNPKLNFLDCANKNYDYVVCDKHFQKKYCIRKESTLTRDAIPTLRLPRRAVQQALIESVKFRSLSKRITNVNDVLNEVPFTPGVPNVVIEHLKFMSNNLSELSKYCILTYDEMHLTPYVHYNETQDLVEGFKDMGSVRESKFANRALVFMVCGIARKWEIPVAYTFFQNVLSYLDLACVLQGLSFELNHVIGLNVVAIVCEESSASYSSLKSLTETVKEYDFHFAFKQEDGRSFIGVTTKKEIPLKDLLMRNFNKKPIENLLQKIQDFCHNSHPDYRKFVECYRKLCIQMLNNTVGTVCEGYSPEVAFKELQEFVWLENNDEGAFSKAIDVKPLEHYQPCAFYVYQWTEITNYIARRVVTKNGNCKECEKIFTILELSSAKSKQRQIFIEPLYSHHRKYTANTLSEYVSFCWSLLTREIPYYLTAVNVHDTLLKILQINCKSSEVTFGESKCRTHTNLRDQFDECLIKYRINSYSDTLSLCLAGSWTSKQDPDTLQCSALDMQRSPNI